MRGRPLKNKYDVLRVKRLYKYIHSKWDMTDYEIAARMHGVYRAIFKENVSFDALKIWISFLKRGGSASISVDHLWSLIYSVTEDFYNEIDIDGLVRMPCIIKTEIDRDTALEMATILHYAISPKFIDINEILKYRKRKKEKIFLKKGHTLYSFFYTSENYLMPHLWVLEKEDIAISIAEILNCEIGQVKKTVTHCPNKKLYNAETLILRCAATVIKSEEKYESWRNMLIIRNIISLWKDNRVDPSDKGKPLFEGKAWTVDNIDRFINMLEQVFEWGKE